MDILTSSMTFYDVSVYCNRFSKTEMRQFYLLGTDGLKIYLFTFRLRVGNQGLATVWYYRISWFSSFAVAVFKIFALRYYSCRTHRSDLVQSKSLLSSIHFFAFYFMDFHQKKYSKLSNIDGNCQKSSKLREEISRAN